MNKFELATLLAKRCEMTKRKANEVITNLIEIISDGLYSGQKITIKNWGTFIARYKKPEFRRLPNTGERVLLPARFVPQFRCSKVLKDKFLVDFG